MISSLYKYPKNQQDLYFAKKNLLINSRNEGVDLLIKHLESQEQVGGESFFMRISEFNIALFLHKFLSLNGKEFQYENQSVGRIDFLFENIAMDVRAIGLKSYEIKSREIMKSKDEIHNFDLGQGIKVKQQKYTDHGNGMGGIYREMDIKLMPNGILKDQNYILEKIKNDLENLDKPKSKFNTIKKAILFCYYTDIERWPFHISDPYFLRLVSEFCKNLKSIYIVAHLVIPWKSLLWPDKIDPQYFKVLYSKDVNLSNYLKEIFVLK